MKIVKGTSDMIRTVFRKRYHLSQHPLMHQLEGIIGLEAESGLLLPALGLNPCPALGRQVPLSGSQPPQNEND